MGYLEQITTDVLEKDRRKAKERRQRRLNGVLRHILPARMIAELGRSNITPATEDVDTDATKTQD